MKTMYAFLGSKIYEHGMGEQEITCGLLGGVKFMSMAWENKKSHVAETPSLQESSKTKGRG